MNLKQYLANEGLTCAAFGKRVAVSGEAVRLWAEGLRYPSRKNMEAIYRATNGTVTPNDFFAGQDAA